MVSIGFLAQNFGKRAGTYNAVSCSVIVEIQSSLNSLHSEEVGQTARASLLHILGSGDTLTIRAVI